MNEKQLQEPISFANKSLDMQLPQKSGAYSSIYSDTSSEGVLLSEKFDNFKIAVTQLQNELKAEKIKNQGFKTLIESTRELKSENIHLRKDVMKKDKAVAILQNRLWSLGESSDIASNDGEILIPGPSKQILISLTEENCKLKESLRYMNVDPTHVEQLQKVNKDLSKKELGLKQMLQKSQEEVTALKKILGASQDEKDQEIFTLKKKITELNVNSNAQSILCQSLTDEAESLKAKLGQFSKQCRALEVQLGDSFKQAPSFSFPSSMENTYSNHTSDTLLQEIAREKEKLQQQLSKKNEEYLQIVDMNSRWQNYNDQREQYVHKLVRSLKEKDEQLLKCGQQSTGISEEQQAEIDKIILHGKKKIEMVEEEKLKIESENRSLLRKVAQFERVLREKDEEIRELRENIQALSDNEVGHVNETDRERIEILEHQIKICTDDFHQERKDRENAVSKIAALERELEFSKRQLQTFQAGRLNQMAESRTQALSRYEQQYLQEHSNSQTGLIPRGGMRQYQCDGVEEDGDSGEDIIDSPHIIRTSSNEQQFTSVNHKTLSPYHKNNRASSDTAVVHYDAINTSRQHRPHTEPSLVNSAPLNERHLRTVATSIRQSSPPKQDNILHCPKCKMAFSAHEHLDLLDHINDCC